MSSNNISPTTHVIFDFIGTLWDINNMIEKVLKVYTKSIGKELPRSLLDKLPEYERFEAIHKLFEALELKDSMTYEEFQGQIMSRAYGFKEMEMVPGAQKLLKHLFEKKIPMAIATNLDNCTMRKFLKRTVGLNPEYLTHYVCGADDPEVKNNKPAPDIYLVCASRFNLPIKSMDSCVIFEDSIRGISGAVTTGMKTVLINRQMKEQEFERIDNKITVIVDSLQDFRPESVGLPPY